MYGIFTLHLPYKSTDVGEYATHGWYGISNEASMYWRGRFYYMNGLLFFCGTVPFLS